MSYLDTKQALVNNLISSGITDNVAYENNTFDPEGLNFYLACYFIPATTESTGKTLASSDEQRGIFQVSVFVKKNSGNFDNLQLSVCDQVRSAFKNTTQIVYNGQVVSILESTINNGFESESWFKRDVSINYLTFSSRG